MIPRLLLPLLLAACAGPSPVDTDTDTDPTVDSDTDTDWQRPQGGTVVFETTDFETIPATYWPASSPDRPAFVLMHGAYSEHGRHSWPPALLDGLEERDWTYLVPDMRGCGEATGDWRQIWTNQGIRDVDMYVQRLRGDGYQEVVLVAGTWADASMNGWVYRQSIEEDGRLPLSMTYLTSYELPTEHLVSMEKTPDRPSLFLAKENYLDWAEQQMEDKPETWRLHVYPGTAGLDTVLFDTQPEAVDHILAYYDDLLGE